MCLIKHSNNEFNSYFVKISPQDRWIIRDGFKSIIFKGFKLIVPSFSYEMMYCKQLSKWINNTITYIFKLNRVQCITDSLISLLKSRERFSRLCISQSFKIQFILNKKCIIYTEHYLLLLTCSMMLYRTITVFSMLVPPFGTKYLTLAIIRSPGKLHQPFKGPQCRINELKCIIWWTQNNASETGNSPSLIHTFWRIDFSISSIWSLLKNGLNKLFTSCEKSRK